MARTLTSPRVALTHGFLGSQAGRVLRFTTGPPASLTSGGGKNLLKGILSSICCGCILICDLCYFSRYDYCHLATDMFLSDPEDGTVEKGRGQLSYGNNRGHKSGQCHTTGMRDSPQAMDSNRNSEMNANAKY